MTFSQAFDYLRRYAEEGRDETVSMPFMMEAECVILDHQPCDSREASIMIGALIDNLEAGARSDGRDLRALSSLQAWLAAA